MPVVDYRTTTGILKIILQLYLILAVGLRYFVKKGVQDYKRFYRMIYLNKCLCVLLFVGLFIY